MKVFLCLALCAAVAFAESPLYRQQSQQQRYFFARQQEETTDASAPYAARGWRPEGPAFNLPQRQQKQQQQPQVDNAYGPPPQPQEQYGPPPSQQYGPPQQPSEGQGPSPRQRAPSTLQPQRFAKQQQPQQPQQYGAPAEPEPQEQYGAPNTQEQYRAPNTQEQYRAPNTQEQYRAPNTQEQYRAPNTQEQSRAPARQQQFAQQQQFGRQQQPQQFGRQQQQQQQQYGAPQPQPQEQYGAPQGQYGAPEYTTTEVPNATEIDEPVTVGGLGESESEQISSGANELEGEEGDLDGQPRGAQQDQSESQQQRGEYYVALPDGRLQRVRYVSRQDLEAMRYFAKIRAENVEPLRGPIYAYSPLQKLQVAPGSLQVAVAPAAVPVAPSALTVTATEAKPQKLVQQQPKVDIKPLAQVQYQHDNPAAVVPLSSSYTTYTANYQVPAAPTEERFILAFP